MNTGYIDISFVKKRIRCLNEGTKPNRYNITPRAIYENAMNDKTSLSQAYNICVESWENLDPDQNIAFEQLMELFDKVHINSNNSDNLHNYNHIIEAVIPKVRSGAKTQSYIKRKIGRLKTKLQTKINNKVEDMASANISSKINIKGAAISSPKKDEKEEVNEQLIKFYEGFNEAIERNIHTDRLIENYNRISRRYNIDKLVENSVDVYDLIFELCNFIDTYDIEKSNRIAIALETMLFLNYKHNINESHSEIMSYVADYYIANNYSKNAIKHVLEATLFYDRKRGDKKNVEIITEEDPEDDMDEYDDELDEILFTEGKIKDYMNRKKAIRKEKWANVKHNREIIKSVNKGTGKNAIEMIKAEIRAVKAINLSKLMPVVLKVVKETLYDTATYLAFGIIFAPIILIIKRIINENNDPKIVRQNIKYIERDILKTQQRIQDSDDEEFIKKSKEYIKTLEKAKSDLEKYKKKLENSVLENAYEFDEILFTETKVDIKKVKETSKEVFNAFKKGGNITVEALKSTVRKLYSRKDTDIIDEVPHILSYIRTVFITGGAFALNPILGVVVFIADKAIELTIKRKDTEKMIKAYNKEKEKAQKKLDNAKTDSAKERHKEYIKSLDKSIVKLEEYYKVLLTEKESDEYDDAKYAVDDDEFDFSFDEHAFENIVDTVMEYYNGSDIFNNINELPSQLGYDDINTITEYISSIGKYNDKLNLLSILEEKLSESRSKKDYMMIECYYNNISKLNNSMDSKVLSVYEMIIYNENKSIIVESMLNPELDIINELSFVNNLKLAAEKVKKKMVKMSDKEKSISKTIDTSVEIFRKAAERAVQNENRESIIKGSVLPSASKILKLAGTSTALAVMVHPVMAVITTLGYLGCSAKMKYKERQMVLDEIELELKMTDRYLKAAEDKNDLEAQKELLKIQRNLERQHQRIKYKMRVNFNQNVKDPEKRDD